MTTNFVFNPQQQYLFNRVWALSLGPSGQAAAAQYTTLRVRFDIDKNALGTSNKAKFEIYNLSTQSRQNVKDGYVLRWQAGYNGLFDTIFLGNVLMEGLKSRRDGPDVILELLCGDGESSIVFATFDQTYPAGIALFQILQDVAKALGVGAGSIVSIPEVNYQNGYVAHGRIQDTLNDLCRTNGLEWSVQNGNLNIMPVGKTNGQSAIVISSGVTPGTSSFDPSKCTGLIGVPSMSGGVLQFTSLLNPKIQPGSLVQLVSENQALNGFYKIRRAHFEGDTRDNKWQVACEGVSAPNVSASNPAAVGFKFATALVPGVA